MENSFKTYRLGEIYDFSSGLSKKREEFGFGFKFISFKDVFNNYFIPDKLNELVNSTEKEREKCSIRRGDVFLTRTSEKLEELGMSSVALRDYPNATFNGFTKRLRAKNNVIIVPEYAGFYFRSPRFRSEITAMASMTTRASLNNEMMGKLSIVVPKVIIQERIVTILLALDNKIKINNEMNKTLEEMAQAIFKSWFVDFEPFKDEEFEENELGMIPKGWNVCSLKDICNINMGQSPSSETYNEDKEGLAFYQGVKDFTERFPLVSTYCKEPKKVAMAGDILLSVRAPVGRINISLEECCIGRGCAALSSEKYGNGFLYYLLRNIKWGKYESGTVFSSIKKSDIENYKVILPNVDTINKFNKVINSLDNRIYNNSVQSRDLEKTRDILLPKLISGEIKL